MSNRNFDSRVIIQRLQQQNYARNLYKNNVNGQGLINNPQNSDGTSSRLNTFVSGAQTDYFRGLLGGGETVSVGGTFGIPTIISPTAQPITQLIQSSEALELALPPSRPDAPVINSVVSENTQLTVNFTSGLDGGSAITNYQYSMDNGITWESANTTVSPFVITGLINGTSYSVILRAVNLVGSGASYTFL
jgi:hypothetical protein